MKTNRELYDEADRILGEFKDAVKIKKIVNDGHGYNYGVKADLTQEALAAHMEYVRRKKADLGDRFKYLLTHLDI